MQDKLAGIWNRIGQVAARSGRAAHEITLVAVSKMVDVDQVRVAAALGITDFGENRVQELLRKNRVFPDLRWHMIGRLQTNKVRDLIGQAVMVHSLDRWNLAEELNHRAQLQQCTVDVLLQVNIAGEKQKGGVNPSDVENFLSSVGQLPALQVKGMMTMAPEVDNPETVRPIFRELYRIRQEMINKSLINVDLQYLSMGMSQDFEIAIQEGANLVRIGSAIFT